MHFSFHIFLTLVILIKISEGYNQFLSSVSGEVTKGNFTYYTMSYDGTILLELISTTGDCDLYISQKKQKPGYEPEENCLQSVTCGLDTILVPKSFKRPIGIGIFGHSSHELSSYLLLFYRVEDSRDLLHFDPYTEALQSHINKKSRSQPEDDADVSEENDIKSLLWAFLRSALLFIIEVVL